MIDFSLFTDELNYFQLLDLLLVIWIKNLDLVPLIHEEVLHDRRLVAIGVPLLEIYALNQDSVGIVQFKENITGVASKELDVFLAVFHSLTL